MNRLIGEWKALLSAFKHWRLISPYIKCQRCGGWFELADVCLNGLCLECDRFVDDEVDAWSAGHEQGWQDCVAEMNRRRINEASKKEGLSQIELDFGGDVPS